MGIQRSRSETKSILWVRFSGDGQWDTRRNDTTSMYQKMKTVRKPPKRGQVSVFGVVEFGVVQRA